MDKILVFLKVILNLLFWRWVGKVTITLMLFSWLLGHKAFFLHKFIINFAWAYLMSKF